MVAKHGEAVKLGQMLRELHSILEDFTAPQHMKLLQVCESAELLQGTIIHLAATAESQPLKAGHSSNVGKALQQASRYTFVSHQ